MKKLEKIVVVVMLWLACSFYDYGKFLGGFTHNYPWASHQRAAVGFACGGPFALPAAVFLSSHWLLVPLSDHSGPLIQLELLARGREHSIGISGLLVKFIELLDRVPLGVNGIKISLGDGRRLIDVLRLHFLPLTKGVFSSNGDNDNGDCSNDRLEPSATHLPQFLALIFSSLLFAICGFRYVQLTGCIEDEPLKGMLYFVAGCLLLLIAWITIHVALDLKDCGKAYWDWEHLL